LEHSYQIEGGELAVSVLSYFSETYRDDESVQLEISGRALSLINHPDPDVQTAALSAYAYNSDLNSAHTAINNIIFTDNESPELKIAAIEALINLGVIEDNTAVFDRIRAISNDPNEDNKLRSKALEILLYQEGEYVEDASNITN
jgi:thioredoxin-like negative regulator of GroEL